MGILDPLSRFFGFNREPPSGQWPRQVGLHERPPTRLPILPPHQRPKYPDGIREWGGPGDRSMWEPFKPKRQKLSDVDRMNRFLQDGAVAPEDNDE
jgi:hypothetical protein